jgi:hypothetical protein
VHWSLVGEAGTVEIVDAGGLLAVVEVAGTVIEGDEAFGFVVATEEPHPSATIPAIGISAATASRLIERMSPSSF